LWPASRRGPSHRVATARAVQAPTGRALRAKQAAAIWPSVAIHRRRRLPPSPDLQPLSQCTPLPPPAAATAGAAQEDKEATTPKGGSGGRRARGEKDDPPPGPLAGSPSCDDVVAYLCTTSNLTPSLLLIAGEGRAEGEGRGGRGGTSRRSMHCLI
jgi:hypothetical protein